MISTSVKPREVREIFFRRDDKEKTIEGSYFFYGSKVENFFQQYDIL